MHIVALAKPTIMLIHLFYKAQVVLLTNIEIFAKYFNFSNIFSLDSAVELPEHIRINYHLINLLKDKQTPYGLIYS